MSIEIKTTSIDPIRNTYSNVARRIGADKPASRYQEATFDLQPEVNFHYRPTWDSEFELYDPRRTCIKMSDWYAFLDPRQFYYGTWVIKRSRQQEVADRNFSFVERRQLLAKVPKSAKERALAVLVPLRHLEYAANLNNFYITSYGYGTAITQAASFNGIDRLGIAQYLTRLALLLDENSGQGLESAKRSWLEDDHWQPLRALAERMLVTRDWFELYVAQNVVLDGMLYPLIYEEFDAELAAEAGSTFSMLMEFQNEWYAETSRWVEATLKTAAAECEENRARVEQWVHKWTQDVIEALTPVAAFALGAPRGESQIQELKSGLWSRLNGKAGLALVEEPNGSQK